MEQNESILEDMRLPETEASFGKKMMINLIDIVIEIGMIIGFYFLVPADLIVSLFEGRSYMKYVIAFGFVFGYRLICILTTGRTIGMAACKVKYLNSRLEPLSTGEKLTVVAINRTGIKYYNA